MLKTRGIVFRTVKFGETSVISEIFTEEQGLHTFIAGGVRAAKSRMPFGLFQPMSVIELVSYFKSSPDAMNRLKEARTDLVYQSIPFDIRKGAVALFMAEVCRKSIHETEENRPLFEFLLENLEFLDSTAAPIANIHLHFLLGLSAFLGFQPQDEMAAGELFFDLKEGDFLSVPPMHPAYLPPDLTLAMIKMLRSPLEFCHEIVLSREQRRQLLLQLLQFFQLHVPGFSDVHTPDILEEVLG